MFGIEGMDKVAAECAQIIGAKVGTSGGYSYVVYFERGGFFGFGKSKSNLIEIIGRSQRIEHAGDKNLELVITFIDKNFRNHPQLMGYLEKKTNEYAKKGIKLVIE